MNIGPPLLSVCVAASLLALQPSAAGQTSVGHARPTATASPTPRATRQITLIMGLSESLPATLQRGGLASADCTRASRALADDFDIVNPHPGLNLAVEAGDDGRLLALRFVPRADTRLTLTRLPADAFRLERADLSVYDAPRQVSGDVEGSLYLSLIRVGVAPTEAVRLERGFGRGLDLTRDVASGDRFRLVFHQRRSADGRPLTAPALVFIELATAHGPVRLYRLGDQDGGEWVDGSLQHASSGLLRTPVAGARISSGFGMRLHPILGFTRLHQGLDFAAATGAPVLAAGDGVIEEARWAGDLGRWVKIRHGPGLETGYAHLSAWAAGMVPGTRVRQGQVIAYVGATGLATGPHLHYEVIDAGQPIDPAGAAARGLAASPLMADSRLRARKADIDALVAQAGAG